MTTDLWMLIATALLCLGTTVIYGAGRFMQPGGIAWAAGNRESELTVPAWVSRAIQAHANLVENLAPFAVLVLVAHVSGKANGTTALGATVFFWCRIGYLLSYVGGIRYMRTFFWFVSWAGGALVLSQLFQ